ncbi:hypothetical protein HDU84_005301 [Entophlyctis sp. JEL0112]|nr:hypothetical protein HDU84_005301 [Entophlyctis sp. JEL0112]
MVLRVPAVFAACFVPGDKAFIVLSKSYLHSYNMAALDQPPVLSHVPDATALCAAPKSRFAFVGFASGKVLAVSITTSNTAPLYVIESTVNSAIFSLSARDNLLAMLHEDGTCTVWDIPTRITFSKFKVQLPPAASPSNIQIQFSKDGSSILVNNGQSISVWCFAQHPGNPKRFSSFFKLKKDRVKHPEEYIAVADNVLFLPQERDVQVRDFDFRGIYGSDEFTLYVAWTAIDVVTKSFISVVSATAKGQQEHTIPIQYLSESGEVVSKMSLCGESLLVAGNRGTLLEYVIQLQGENQELQRMLYEESADRLPASLGPFMVSPALAVEISQFEMESSRLTTFVLTAHSDNGGTVRLWSVESGNTISIMVDSLCLKAFISFNSNRSTASNGSDSEERILMSYSSGGWLVTASGAIVLVLRKRTSVDDDEGEIDINEDLMADIDRAVDEALGLTATADGSFREHECSLKSGTSEKPAVTKQITSLQLEDVEATTPAEAEDQIPSAVLEQQDRFVKNPTCLVSFIDHTSLTEEWSGRWKGCLQIMASGVIEVEKLWPAMNLLAFGTAYGDFTVVNIVTGETIFTHVFGGPDDERNRISLVYFAFTFIGKGKQKASVLFVLTLQ